MSGSTLIEICRCIILRPLCLSKKQLCVCLMFSFCLLVTNGYSQNLYRRGKMTNKGLRVRRIIQVSPKHWDLAREVTSLRASTAEMRIVREVAQVQSKFRQPLVKPYQVVGGYNYLKMIGKTFKNRPGWRSLGESGWYNGAHHIVTQTVITKIAEEAKIADTAEMKANAPAVYSLLHNHPAYSDLFHDHQMLLDTYHRSGVKGIVTEFFERLNAVNEKVGLPLYDEEFINATLLEAELWAKHWNIRWE